jgi:hypothetical protein
MPVLAPHTGTGGYHSSAGLWVWYGCPAFCRVIWLVCKQAASANRGLGPHACRRRAGVLHHTVGGHGWGVGQQVSIYGWR